MWQKLAIRADRQAQGDAIMFESAGLVARFEVTLVIEQAIVEQMSFVVSGHDAACPDDGCGVVQFAVQISRMPDDQRHVMDLGGETGECLLAGLDKVCP